MAWGAVGEDGTVGVVRAEAVFTLVETDVVIDVSGHVLAP